MAHDDASTTPEIPDYDLIPRPVFWLYAGIVWSLLIIAMIVAGEGVARSLGHRRLPEGFGAAIGMVATVLAPGLVDRILRLFGASRSGKTVERRKPVRLTPAEEDEDTARPIELFYKRNRLIGLSLLMLLSSLLMGLMVVMDARQGWHWTHAVVVLLSAGSLWYALTLAWELRTRQPYLRIDPDGVTAVPSNQTAGSRRHFVPWCQVATCEVETTQDTWGRVTHSHATFQDAQGHALLTVSLPWGTVAHEAERSQALKAIRARLPKPTDVAWEREVV
jgi:hypothetical protein